MIRFEIISQNYFKSLSLRGFQTTTDIILSFIIYEK